MTLMKKLINLWPSIKQQKNKINIKIILHYHYKKICRDLYGYVGLCRAMWGCVVSKSKLITVSISHAGYIRYRSMISGLSCHNG